MKIISLISTKRRLVVYWDGITTCAFDRAFKNTKWDPKVDELMKDTEKHQKGNRFKTRITKVISPPVVTYAGRKVHMPEKAEALEAKSLFDFLLKCQTDFDDRNVMKTSLRLDMNPIRQTFNNLPRKYLSRHFW